MILSFLKGLLTPGTSTSLIIVLLPGVLLLYRRKDGGRAGAIWITTLVLSHLALSVPIIAVGFVNALSPSYPPVRTMADARGATAIVVLAAGFETYRSRGDVYTGAQRQHALRIMEAARVYRVLDRPWVIVTGTFDNGSVTESGLMAMDLKNRGVDPDRIIEEPKAANTREHALFVPPILKERGVTQFVLVTSQQHIARALKAFQKVGWNPIPSTPEFFVRGSRGAYAPYLPREPALEASSAMLYDELAMVYYWFRGWI
jgi:uncharacterized SAM-binding protein YcdF (DUF218 family)